MKNQTAAAACRDYVGGVVPLMIWHVWDQHRSTGRAIEELLDCRVDIARQTSVGDAANLSGAWRDLKAQLARIIARCADDSQTAEMEQACLELVWPMIEPTISDRVREIEAVRSRNYGCWRIEPYRAKPRTLAIHFANAYQPRSPFRDVQVELVATLRSMLRDAIDEHPDAERVTCGSWLNQFEPFRALFPETWRLSFVPNYDYPATWGWWGQYMDHRGSFHATRAANFRTTRRHPYTCGDCECLLHDALAHLDRIRACSA